jgi:hypothetical protein
MPKAAQNVQFPKEQNGNKQDRREVTVHPDNTHLTLNMSLKSTAQHAV